MCFQRGCLGLGRLFRSVYRWIEHWTKKAGHRIDKLQTTVSASLKLAVTLNSRHFKYKLVCAWVLLVFSHIYWLYSCHLVVSWNRGTPKSSILMGFSLFNQPFLDTPIYIHLWKPPFDQTNWRWGMDQYSDRTLSTSPLKTSTVIASQFPRHP